MRSPGKVNIKVCSLDPVTQISAPKPYLDPFQLLHFVCIIVLIKGGGLSQNCSKTELNQLCLKNNKQEIEASGGCLPNKVRYKCKISSAKFRLGKTFQRKHNTRGKKLGIVHQEIKNNLMLWQHFTSQNRVPSQKFITDIRNVDACMFVPTCIRVSPPP